MQENPDVLHICSTNRYTSSSGSSTVWWNIVQPFDTVMFYFFLCDFLWWRAGHFMQIIPPASVNFVFEPQNGCFMSERAICSINVWLAVKCCFWSVQFKPVGPIKLWLLVYYIGVLRMLNGNMKSCRIRFYCVFGDEHDVCVWRSGPSATVTISNRDVCCTWCKYWFDRCQKQVEKLRVRFQVCHVEPPVLVSLSKLCTQVSH